MMVLRYIAPRVFYIGSETNGTGSVAIGLQSLDTGRAKGKVHAGSRNVRAIVVVTEDTRGE